MQKKQSKEDKSNLKQQKTQNQKGNNTEINDYNYQCYKQLMNLKQYKHQIQKKIQELNEKRDTIYSKVSYYEKKTQEQFRDFIRGEAPERKKRNRRNAEQIQREYICSTCNKKYGSQGSLNQHVKLKHPQKYEPKKKSSKMEESSEQQKKIQ